MLFNSIDFLLFFPIFVILYFLTPYRFRWVVLLVASYFFYMYWKAVYALLLIASTAIDYFCGRMMGSYEEPRRRKPYLYLSLLSNLSILFFFKYFNFFTESVHTLLNSLNIHYSPALVDVLLPMGISFYTFQTMGYSIDVYYGRIKPEKHLGIFALFVTFFPQLVAGPIERAGDLLRQFREKYDFSYNGLVLGVRLMGWGMFKKVVIADNLAPLVNQVYNNPTSYEGISLIIATVFFAFQIYCDFSGYSDIAIGAARVMGFRLMQNFRRPYFSKNIREFWSRWHISLSTWFRDYVYVPLGGNRVVKWRWYYNLFLTFLVSGLWHGAAWTFIVWGALHGFYQIVGLITRDSRNALNSTLGLHKYPKLLNGLQIASTFFLVCLAWVFFRANNLADALYIIRHSVTGLGNVFELNPNTISHILFLDQNITIFVIAVAGILLLEMLHLVQENISINKLLQRQAVWLRWSLYYALIIAILLFGNFGHEEFIYFQF
ncbi:MBOAT family O-acyltransferase [Pontibacter silvestris]|uniref:MBOAT family O-acyltransferase n=1 Tax=Pontibacter silvestris TaxID=2305183 RepID=A0ABW4WUZ2_9BACT|nr:MBOAT family O-acyltransferase [Pontibacter silvestris]MCC9136457.1 MBOAT family protein [Pontibacter silvestris]